MQNTTPTPQTTAAKSTALSSLLIVDDEPGICRFLQKGLRDKFDLIEVASNTFQADELCQRCHFDLIISDIRLPERSGVAWIADLRERGNHTKVIFMSAFAELDTAIDALRAGASDFIIKPFRLEQMNVAIERCIEHQQIQRENFVLRRQIAQIMDDSGIIGDSEAMQSVCNMIKRIAPLPSTILIEGESGTGKELAARAVHKWSQREGHFVALNCGALSAELLESELFGHTKGAYTGATDSREGLFSYANKGTLFLDEIGEMPLSMQTHLLRVLEDQCIRPVGSNREIPIDVRIIAATNRTLTERAAAGHFRQDLYYRLNVLSIELPPLRERLDDIEPLVQHFMALAARNMGLSIPAINQQEINRLKHYHWPGNIRELKNVVERSTLLNQLPSQCIGNAMNTTPSSAQAIAPSDLTLAAIEREHILSTLAAHEHNKSSAARALDISRKTLERKLKRWQDAD